MHRVKSVVARAKRVGRAQLCLVSVRRFMRVFATNAPNYWQLFALTFIKNVRNIITLKKGILLYGSAARVVHFVLNFYARVGQVDAVGL